MLCNIDQIRKMKKKYEIQCGVKFKNQKNKKENKYSVIKNIYIEKI